MTTKLSVNAFHDLLVRSGLLTTATIDNYRNLPPNRVAYQMIADGVLTEFQAKQLISGRFRNFFIAEKYKILDILGKGGMGRVMLCEHLMLQRLVAVKIMFRSRETKPGAIERFLREARAAAKFDHPNLARVFDVDNTENGPYIVMEYVDGMNLHDLVVKVSPLSWQRVANYIRQAALGLQQAHLAGLVHRDIKPSNLMLDRAGTVKLLDLGLARFFDQEPDDGLTSAFNPNAVLGTADFIAPEQAMDSSRADIRADIYSLGCTFYFMLMRSLPAGTGTTLQKLLRHQSKEPEPICTSRPDVPAELVAIVEKMMKKDMADRYQTPGEVAELLLPFAGEKLPVPTPEEMPPQRLAGFLMGLSASPSSRSLGEADRATAAMSAPQQGTDIGFGENSGISAGGSAPKISKMDLAATSSAARVPASQSLEPLPSFDPLASASDPLNGSYDPLASAAATIANSFDPLSQTTAPSPVSPPAKKGPSAKNPRTTVPNSVPNESASSANTLHQYQVVFPQLAAYQKIGLAILGMMVLGTCGVVLWSFYWATYPAPGGLPKNLAQVNREAQPQPPEPPPAPPQNVGVIKATMRGGGSTFVKPLMDHWAVLYEKKASRRIEYTGAGSSKGVEGVLSRFLDFGCSDAPLTDKQIADAGVAVQHVPIVMGAVVPTFNLTNEKGEPLPVRFTGALLANIYLGKVKKWNDTAISANNPGVTLPDLDITVVARKDGSGTTNIWTDYLAKQSAAWKEQVGVGNSVNWPTGITADKNNGVADVVSRTTGSIGYVELSYAIANNLPVGPVRNRAGTYVLASVESISAAAAGSSQSIPTDLRYSLTDAAGTNSYPIVGTCWAMVCVDLPEVKRREVVEFLLWATGEGQEHVAQLHYGRLPPELVEKVHAALQGIGK